MNKTDIKWRDLALQFDGHRMQAISLLKMIVNDAPDDQYSSVRDFLKSGPLSGEEVLRERIAQMLKENVPVGWKLVPIEPTEDMLIHGFESEPDEIFSDYEDWEKYQEMTGCQQAEHRARLCWNAMLKASPEFN